MEEIWELLVEGRLKDVSKKCLPILKKAYPEFDWSGWLVLQVGKGYQEFKRESVLGVCYPKVRIITLLIDQSNMEMWYFVLLHEATHSVVSYKKPLPPVRGYYHTKRFNQLFEMAMERR